MSDLEKQLARSLFAEGFQLGASEARERGRRPPHRARGQEHVTAGFWAGRAAAEQALAEYTRKMEAADAG